MAIWAISSSHPELHSLHTAGSWYGEYSKNAALEQGLVEAIERGKALGDNHPLLVAAAHQQANQGGGLKEGVANQGGEVAKEGGAYHQGGVKQVESAPKGSLVSPICTNTCAKVSQGFRDLDLVLDWLD